VGEAPGEKKEYIDVEVDMDIIDDIDGTIAAMTTKTEFYVGLPQKSQDHLDCPVTVLHDGMTLEELRTMTKILSHIGANQCRFQGDFRLRRFSSFIFSPGEAIP